MKRSIEHCLHEKERVEKLMDGVKKIIVEKLGFEEIWSGGVDCRIVRRCVELIAGRAGRLSTRVVAAVLVQTERESLVGKAGEGRKPKRANEKFQSGVDGRVIQHSLGFERRLSEAPVGLLGEELQGRVEIGMAKDGSGVRSELPCT